MSDIVESAPELIRKGHLNELRGRFLEPGSSSMPQAQFEKVTELYDLAVKLDANDPVGWIKDFAMTVPLDLEVEGEKTRIGKVLVLAKIYARKKAADAKGGVAQRRRDF